MTGSRHVPIRMCVGCGARAPQAELLRIISAPDGSLAFLGGRSAPGRSAYLHRDHECWRRFTTRKGPVRSLGRVVDRERRLALMHDLQTARVAS